MYDAPEVFVLVKLESGKEQALLFLRDVRTFTMFLYRELFN